MLEAGCALEHTVVSGDQKLVRESRCASLGIMAMNVMDATNGCDAACQKTENDAIVIAPLHGCRSLSGTLLVGADAYTSTVHRIIDDVARGDFNWPQLVLIDDAQRWIVD